MAAASTKLKKGPSNGWPFFSIQVHYSPHQAPGATTGVSRACTATTSAVIRHSCNEPRNSALLNLQEIEKTPSPEMLCDPPHIRIGCQGDPPTFYLSRPITQPIGQAIGVWAHE